MLSLLLLSGALLSHAQGLNLDVNSAGELASPCIAMRTLNLRLDLIKSAASSIAEIMVGYLTVLSLEMLLASWIYLTIGGKVEHFLIR